MLEAFEKYKSLPFFKYFLVLFSVIVVYLAYNIYIWSHIESTDNASIKNIEIIEQKTLITQFNLQQSKEAVDFANTNLEINSTEYTRAQELNKGNFSSQKTLDESRMSFI